MPTEIYLLKVGMNMTEGVVEEWYIVDVRTAAAQGAPLQPLPATKPLASSPMARKLARELGISLNRVRAPARVGGLPRRTWMSTWMMQSNSGSS